MLFLLLFLIFDFANALFIPVGGQDITYTSARSGTCTGSRVGPRMFAGNGDNSGANKITRCGEWCLKRNTPLQANGIDVWINVDQTTTPRVLPFKDLRGFAVDSTGRCYCEMAPVVGPDMCTTVFAGSYQSYAFECPLWYYLDDGGGTISVNSECKACPRGTEGEVFNYAYPLEQCSDINECELISGSFPTNPCHNGGTCTESSTRAYIPVGEINCDCQSGFDGENCQNTKCANGGIQACQNGGICLDKCYCPAGYVGERCERQTEAGAPCNNGMNYKGSSLVPQKVLGHQNGNIAEYCYNSGSYSNQYRPYDGASDNPGTTYDEKLLHCFRACIDFDGAGTSLGPNDAYTDKTYFQNHEWWQTPHVLMNLDGRCYCYGSHLEVVDHECVDAASTYLLSAYYRGYNVIHNCEAAHSEHVVTLGSGRDRPMCDTCERSLDCASSLTCGQPKPAGYGSGSLDYNFAKGRQCLPDTVQDPQNRFCYTGSVDPYPALGLVKDSSLTRDEIFRKCSNACLQSGYVGFNMAAPQVGSTNIPDSSQTFDGCFCNAVTYANCAAGSQGAYAGPTGDGQYYEMHEYTSAGLGFDPSWVSAVATTIDECADACRDAWYGSCQLNQVCTEFTGDFHENQNAGDGISGPLTSNDQNPMILLSGNKPTLIFGGIGDARYFKMIQTDFYGNMLSTGYLVTKDLPFNPDPSSNYAMDISELTLALWNARLVPLAFPAAQTTCLNNRYCLQDFEITGSWNQANTGFVYGYAKGFVFNKDQQNCWCDANDSGRDDVCDVSSRPNSAYRRYDFNALWDADYVWAHQYECNSKPNNAADQIIQPLAKSLQACADSCRGLFWSLSRASKGFIYRSVANGGPMCYCEAVHSYPHSECSGTSGGIGTNPDWNRYDFIPNYAFMHYGECRGGPGISNSETQIDRGTGHSLDECAILCKDYTWNNNGGPKTSIGFIYNEGSDSCYCEALYSHPHPDCARATDTLSWARYDYVNYSPVIEFKQDSQCMLTAYSLQPSTTALTGTDEEKAVQCGRVCQGAVVPQYGVDQGFGATGFVVSGTICRCESVPSDSSECDEVSGWKRYDFKIAAGSAYETFGYCAPASSVYQFVDEDQSHTTVEDWSESCRAGCVAHTPQVSHFTFNLLGGCYCMQTGGGAHTEHPCETGSIVISVGSGWYVYTIWDGGVTDVPGCANAGQDVRGLGVCVLDCTASPVASADGSNGEFYCINGGTATGFIGDCGCLCAPGFSGTNCEVNINECAPIPCVNGGVCSDGIASYSCACAGYSGENCEIVDACVGTEAATTTAGEIHCVSSTGSVSGTTGNCLCTCNAGYEGAGCATPKQCVGTEAATTTAGEIHCVSSTGSVSGTTGNCLCTCNAGYEGAGCATDIDDCAVSPCINNGVCNDLVNDYNCACINGFSGKSCDECAAGSGFDGSACVPCENTQANNLITHDAVCANQTCSAGFGVVTDGFDFSLDPLNTTTTNCVACTGIDASPAGNGVCITQTCGENEQVVSVGFDSSLDPTSSNSNCEACAAGFVSTGGLDPLCVDIDECVSTNNANFPELCNTTGTASCNTLGGANTRNCNCNVGYEGTNCETDIDECSPNPCQNGAFCRESFVEAAVFLGDYVCSCQVLGWNNPVNNNGNVGWSGKNCTVNIDECAQGTHNCGSFHTCIDTDGDFYCQCNANFESTAGNPPTCVCPTGYGSTPSTCTQCVYPTTNDQQDSQCTPAECQTDQFIVPSGNFSSVLAYNDLSNCASCVSGKVSDDAQSLVCDDFDECAVGIAATCGFFNDNGTPVQMGTCVESSTDGTIPLTDFKCIAAAGFDCATPPCTDIKECDASPCTGGPNTASCDDTYTSADPTGFRCTCNSGYSGDLCQTADECTLSAEEGKDGTDGTLYCINGGTPQGTTGSCLCSCVRGFSGGNCDECEAGSGLTYDFEFPECVVCANGTVNNDISHIAVCAPLGCAEGFGFTSDISDLTFDFLWDPDDTSTNSGNCRRCITGTESENNNGQCTLCAVGYEGMDCDTASDCKATETATGIAGEIHCKDTGTVSGVTGGCLCTCDTGYAGTLLGCEIAVPCTASDNITKSGDDGHFYCINGGTATGFTGDCGCSCAPGYSGTNCEVNINECAPIPCQHGGVCSDGIASYSCACADGYSGENCEIANACVASDIPGKTGTDGLIHCLSSGIVSGVTGSCVCECNDGYDGPSIGCETRLLCVASDIPDKNGTDGLFYCVNDGTIQGTTGTCSCDCAAGYSDLNCATADACTASSLTEKDGSDGEFYCINGVIGNVTGACTCECINQFSGTNCDQCVSGLGYLLNVSIDLVSFDYGFAQIEACKGTPVKVTWLGNHNIQETEAGDCVSLHIGSEVTGFQSSGSVTYSNDELSALPGTTRYFKCSNHCGSNARFEVSCPLPKCEECKFGFVNNQVSHLAECSPHGCDLGYGFKSDIITPEFTALSSAWDGDNTSLSLGNCLRCPPGTESPASDGQCVLCDTGYGGLDCETDINECNPDPCENEAVCTESSIDANVPLGDYSCACKPGWSDKNCDTNINECIPEPCFNNGVCTDGIASYNCTCAPGYNGTHCETDINECGPEPCENGATCSTPNVNSYECECVPGYNGTNCETDIDECSSNPCVNGVCSTPLLNSYECDCNAGWSGTDCDVDIDECAPEPCQNGVCTTPEFNSYLCGCDEGWSGVDCDVDSNECNPDPCENGACLESNTHGIVALGQYSCACYDGWSGIDCDVDINECNVITETFPHLCSNNTASCSSGPNTRNCVCKSGYEGNLCNVDIDECASEPCLHGNCSETTNGTFLAPNTFHCACKSKWSGPTCTLSEDMCKNNPCQNEAVCQNLINGYLCVCKGKWQGKNCDIRTKTLLADAVIYSYAVFIVQGVGVVGFLALGVQQFTPTQQFFRFIQNKQPPKSRLESIRDWLRPKKGKTFSRTNRFKSV